MGELGIIHDGAILIRDGMLVEVGPSRRVENLAHARQAIEINACGRVVMPGFVDSHTHLAFPPAGLHADDEEGTARMLRNATGQRLELRTRAFLDAMARHGTTTVEVKTGCGADETGEAKLMRVLSAVRNDPLDVVNSYLFRLPPRSHPAGYSELAAWTGAELLPRLQRRRAPEFADLSWDPDPARLPAFEVYLKAARALGFACKIHAEGPAPAGAIELAHRNDVFALDHLEHATEEQARLLGRAGISATLLPGVSLQHDGQTPPARALIEAGVPVALGTNFHPHHAPMLNMQTIVALACWRLNMTVEEAISAATINAAYALGCAARCGSLEPRKSADLIILNASDYRDLRTGIGTNLVHVTMKGGKFIYQEGQVEARELGRLSPHA